MVSSVNRHAKLLHLIMGTLFYKLSLISTTALGMQSILRISKYPERDSYIFSLAFGLHKLVSLKLGVFQNTDYFKGGEIECKYTLSKL